MASAAQELLLPGPGRVFGSLDLTHQPIASLILIAITRRHQETKVNFSYNCSPSERQRDKLLWALFPFRHSLRENIRIVASLSPFKSDLRPYQPLQIRLSAASASPNDIPAAHRNAHPLNPPISAKHPISAPKTAEKQANRADKRGTEREPKSI